MSTNGGNIVVPVGVQLELNNVQEVISILQKALSNIKPDTSAFKGMSKIITEMTREMERLQVQSSKGFSSQKQFDQAGQTVDKLEESLIRAQLAMQNLKFSDLKLNPMQENVFKGFEKELELIEQKLNNVKEKVKQDIFNNDISKSQLSIIDPKGLNKSFDEIDKLINQRAQTVKGEIDGYKAQLSLLNEAINKGNMAQKLLTEGITGDIFGGKYTYTNANGILGFKPGTAKSEFLKALKDEFSLSEADLDQLKNLTLGKISELFKSMGQGNQKNIFEQWVKNLAGDTSQSNVLNEKVKKLEEVQNAVLALQQKIQDAKADGTPLSIALEQNQGDIARVAAAIQQYQNNALGAVNSNQKLNNSFNSMKSQLATFTSQLNAASTEFLKLQSQQQTFNSIKMAITNFMGFTQVLNLTKNAVKEAMSHIKQLDTTMNAIAIVSEMTTEDLWKQVDAYSGVAQKYGTTIQGAYEVSKIYYQAGYETNEVMTLMNETLKLSKVSGLDYAKTTDYMMTATRGFHMEISEAASVVDVYSALAANTAVSQKELAEAMSKTASSMEGVGASFQEASAMIATMVAVTRESSQNIGSSLKSIASRYGELTKDPAKLIDSEGVEMSFNKVDEALQSVGISLQTADHQFRDFTEVILELTDVWDKLDSAQQRYIATQFAGNRQQSRFLALVSNGDLLRENIEVAEDSEDTGTLQALKALDSIESKLNQVQVAYQQFYTSIGAESAWKTALDGIKNFLDGLNSLPKAFEKIPVGAIVVISDTISIVRDLGLQAISLIAKNFRNILQSEFRQTGTDVANETRQIGEKAQEGLKEGFEQNQDNTVNTIFDKWKEKASMKAEEIKSAFQLLSQDWGEALQNGFSTGNFDAFKNDLNYVIDYLTQIGAISQSEAENLRNLVPEEVLSRLELLGQKSEEAAGRISTITQSAVNVSKNFSSIGAALNIFANALNKSSESGRVFSGVLMGISGGLRLTGEIIKGFSEGLSAVSWITVAMGIITVINGIATAIETPEEKLERLNKEAEQLTNTAKQIKSDERTLQKSIDKVEELKIKRYESAEAAEEYQQAVDDLADKFPELIMGFDEAGNVIVDLQSAEKTLAAARQKTLQATYDAAVAEQRAQQQQIDNAKEKVKNFNNSYFGSGYEGLDFLRKNDESSIKENINKILMSKDYNNLISKNLSSGQMNVKDLFEPENLKQLALIIQTNFLKDLDAGAAQSVQTLTDIENMIKNSIFSQNEELQQLLENLKQAQESPEEAANDSAADTMAAFIAQLDNIDFNTEEGQKQYENFIKAYNTLDEGVKDYFNQNIFNVEDLINEIETIVTSDSQIKGVNKSLVDSYLKLIKVNEEGWEFLEQNNNAALLLTNELTKIWGQENNKDLSWDNFKNSEDFKNEIEEFYDAYNKLGEDKQKILEELEIDTRSYTANDVKEMLGTLEEKDNPINSYIDNLFKSVEESAKQFEDIFANYDIHPMMWMDETIEPNPISILKEGLAKINEDLDFSSDALSFIDSQAKQISKVSNDGFIKTAQTLANQIVKLMSILYNESMSSEERATALSIIKNANLQTKEGYDQAIEQIKQSSIDQVDQDALIEQLTKQKQEIIDNVILSLNADLASITEQTENDSKLLSKVTSGLTIKETNELIQSAKGWGLDLTLQDFIPDGDKLIASEEAFIQIQQKYKNKIEEAKEKAEEDLSKAKEIGLYDGESFIDIPNQLTEEQLEFINKQIEGFSKDSENFEGENLSKVGKEKIKEMYKGIEDALFNYGSSVANLFNTVFSEQNWNKGDYSSLMNDPRFALKNPLNNLFIKFDDIFNSKEFNKYLTGEQKYTIDEPQIKKAVEKARSGVDKFLSDLLNKGIDKFNPADYANQGIEKSTYNQMVEDLKNFGNNYVDFIKKYADLTGKTESEIDSLIAQAYNKQNENNAYDALKDIVGSFDQISFEAGQKIVRSIEGFELENFDTDPITGSLQLSYEKALELLNEGIKDKTSKEYNELRAQIEKRQTDLSTSKILSNIIQNRNKLSEENIAAMANIFKTSYDTIERSLTKNNDGTYTIGLDKIQEMIDKAQLVLGHSVSELFSNEIDAIIKSITGITSDQSKGFTDLSSMQKYVKGLRDKGVKLNGKNLNFDQLFEYNESLRAYQLTTQGVIAQIAAGKNEIDNLKNRLKNSTNDTEQKDLLEQINIGETFIQDTIKGFADAIDFESLINATNGHEDSEARKNITQAIEDYNAAKAALVGDGAKFVAINAQALIQAIGGGGANAVAAAQKIAEIRGKTLSDDTVEKLYRKQVNNFVEAIDKVGAQAGEIVDSTTGALISMSGGKVSILEDTGLAVVESAANLYEAYNNLLQRMTATGEATLADLNNVAAKVLENRDGEQQIIDALGDASSMTYTRFGEILAQQGIKLTEQLVDSMANAGIIKQLGGANMAITDFKGLADIFGWDANSEQFVSAFKTYNDSLIQMNRQAERNILEEAQSVADAQGGDWINITQLMSKLQEGFKYVGSEKISLGDSLMASIQKFGANIENGILKLDDSADIPAIMQAVAQAAAESGGLLSNEMAQLADTVADAIKSYADLISGGIEGTLTNTQAEQLQDWANKNGVGQLDFTPTEKGLKVATAQAQKLVAALKNVDSIQGKLTFDKMVEALSADKGGKFENISKTTAEIAKLQKQIAKNKDSIKQLDEMKGMTRDSERIKQSIQNLEQENSKLREQISLYREIQEAQSIDPSQYNFMDRDLPTQFEGPINYWNSVGEAFAAMNESSKTGKMAINDFYNIVNEMENLANISGEAFNLAGYQIGGEASQAAQLITNGLGKLTNIDGKGVKVDLSKLGVDFVSGADSAKSNFADGVHALAESQVAMLDAAIKVLEVVVAMEKLGDVDVNKNNKLDIGEIFGDMGVTDNGDFTKEFSEGAQKLLDFADEVGNEDLKQALNDISINGNTMREMLEVAAKGLSETRKSWKDLNMSEQQYAAVMNAFYEALKNGDYNLDTIQQSVWDIINNLMPDGTVINVGDRSIIISGGTSVTINWKDANISEIVDNVKKKTGDDEKKAKQAIIDSITKANNGTATRTDIVISLAVDEKIEIAFNEDGDPQIKGPDGETIDPESKEGMKIIAEKALERAGVDKITGYKYTSDNKIIGTAEVKIGTSIRLVSTDSEGNVVYHSGITGQDYNSEQEMIDAEIEKVRQQLAENGENISYGEAYERLYHIPYKVNTSVEIDFSDEQAVEKAKQLLEENKKNIIDKLNNSGNKDFTYTHNQNGTITFNMNGVTATVEDTGNLEKDLDSALNSIATKLQYNDLVTGIQTGIENAFSGDVVSTALTKALSAALSGDKKIPVGEDTQPEVTGLSFNAKDPKIAQISGTPTYEGTGEGITPPEVSGIELIAKDPIIKQITGTPTINGGEGNVANEISIPQVVLQPSDITIDITQAGQPTLSNTNGTKDLQMDEVIVKPTNVKLNLDGYTPSSGDASGGNSEEVPINSVTLKPDEVKLNLTGYTPATGDVSGGSSQEVPINSVTLKPSEVKLNLAGYTPSAEGENVSNENVPIGSVTLQPGKVSLDLTGYTPAAEDVPEEVPSNAVTVKPNSITIDTSNKKPEAIDSLEADVSTVNATPSAAPTITNTTGLTSTIDSLNATITTLKASASGVDASEASSSIINKIQEALNNNEFTITVGVNLSGGGDNSGDDNPNPSSPTVGDGGLGNLITAVGNLSTAASTAGGQIAIVSAALLLAKSEQLVAASKATTDAKSEELTNASKATTDAKSTELVAASKATTDAKSSQLTTASEAINDINSSEASSAKKAINDINSSEASNAKKYINAIDSGPASKAKSVLNSISVSLPSSKETDVTLNYKVSKTGAKGNIGNFAQAKGSGPAKVSGSTKTLMGELGPELVVSNGRYFLVGQNGAEFVDLANDAIVFNHLQTRRLMEQGEIGSRGKAFTNERTAVAFAKGKIPLLGSAHAGNTPPDGSGDSSDKEPEKETEKITSVSVSPSSRTFHNLVRFSSRAKGTGPAMASASAALAALKQLRAMWQSLANASLADMGGMPSGSGGGGGGGGGGGDKNDDAEKYTAGIEKNVERWYNWLQLIEKTQTQINKLTKEYNILEKDGVANSEKLANLQQQYEKRLQNQQTRQRLAREQTNYRADLIKDINSKSSESLFKAFYQVDEATGQVYLANDDAFSNYIKNNKNVDKNKTLAKLIRSGKNTEGKTVTFTNTELIKNYRSKYKEKISKDEYNKLSDEEKKYYGTADKEGNRTRLTMNKTDYAQKHRNIKITRKIKTGLDFMEELQAKDDAGNLVHDAKEQLKLIEQMGFKIKDLMTGVDTEQEGWEAQVVQNFYDKIDSDKTEIEALNKSIEEQEEAALEDAAAIQSINEQIREINKPLTGVTEGLEKWYNLSKKISNSQQEINKLTKTLDNLQKDQVANGEKIFINYQQQEESIKRQLELNKKLRDNKDAERQDLENKIKDSGLKNYITSDNGHAYFNENAVKRADGKTNEIETSYTTNKTVEYGGQKYEVDVNGLFRDNEGILRNSKNENAKVNTEYQGTATDKNGKYQTISIKYGKNGTFGLYNGKAWVYYDKYGNKLEKESQEYKALKKASVSKVEIDKNRNFIDSNNNVRDESGKIIGGNFSIVDQETIKSKYDFNNKNIEQVIKDLTAQDTSGKTIFNAEQQYQILKALGLEDFMKYNEKGEEVYDEFGALTKEEMKAAVEAGIKRLQSEVSNINDLADEINDLEEEDLKLRSDLLAINQAFIDNQIEVENLVKDAIVQEHQDAIDTKKSFTDAINDAASKTIEGMRKDLSNEKQTYESDKDNKELTLLRMQLTAAQMSGSSVSKIRDLQKQIQEKQQQMYYDEREKLIDELEDQTNETVEALNQQTEIAQTALDYQVKYGEIWEEVNEKLANSPKALVDFISKNQPDYLSESESARAKTLTDILEKIEIFSSNMKYQGLADERDALLSKRTDSRFNNNAIKEEVLKIGQETFKNTEGTVDEKNKAAQQAMESKIKEYGKTFNQDDAASVTNKINSLGKINFLNQKESVENARKAYDALSEEAKQYVSQDTLNKLKVAEYRIKQIKAVGGGTPEPPPASEQTGAGTGTSSSSPVKTGARTLSTPEKKEDKGLAAYSDAKKNLYDSKKSNSTGIKGTLTNIENYAKNNGLKYGDEALKKRYLKLYKEGKTPHDIAKTFSGYNDINFKGMLGEYYLSKKLVALDFKKGRSYYTKWNSAKNEPDANTKKNANYKKTGTYKLSDISYNTKKKYYKIGGYYYPADENPFTKIIPQSIDLLKKVPNVTKFEKGGEIDFTGPAWVDGTKNKPEHIFNFEQMQALRAHLLSGVDTTARAVAGLTNIIDNLPNANTYNNITNDNSGININNLEFHMEVKEISNDYDARRAGQQAMEEMVRIAYKTGNRSVFRR